MPRLGVNFCVIKLIDGEPFVLLQQRDQNSAQDKGSWVIPGGGVEDSDSSYEDTASREVLEEFAIKISPNELPRSKLTGYQWYNNTLEQRRCLLV